jgi:hypothetical protein
MAESDNRHEIKEERKKERNEISPPSHLQLSFRAQKCKKAREVVAFFP